MDPEQQAIAPGEQSPPQREHPAPVKAPHPRLDAAMRAAGLAGLLAAHALMLVFVLGMHVLPWLAVKAAQEDLSRLLGRPVRVAAVFFNPFTCELQVHDAAIMERDGSQVFAGFGLLDVNLDPSALVTKRIKLARLHLERPVLRLARGEDGVLNLADLLPKAEPPQEDAQESGYPKTSSAVLDLGGLRLTVLDVKVTDGSVLFEDAPMKTSHHLENLQFTMERLESDRTGLRDAFSSSAVINGTPLRLEVRADPFGADPEVQARLELTNVESSRYLPYLPMKHPLEVKVRSVTADTRAVLPGGAWSGSWPVLTAGARVQGLSLNAGELGSATLEGLDVQGVSLLPQEMRFTVERVLLDAPFLRVLRDKDGSIGLVRALEIVRSQDAADPAPDAPPPDLRIGEVTVAGGSAEIRDEGLELSTTLSGLTAGLSGLDLRAGTLTSATLETACSLFDKLSVQAQGAFRSLDMRVTARLEGLDLGKPMPTLKRLVPALNLSGTAGAELDAALSAGAQGKPALKAKADLDLRDLRVGVQGQAKPLLTAKALSVSGAQADLDAKRVDVAQVRLAGGEANLSREQGRFPALDALTGGAQAKAGAQGAAQPSAQPSAQTSSPTPAAQTPAPAASPAQAPAQDQPRPGGWGVQVAQLQVQDMALDYQDQQAKAGLRVVLADAGVSGAGTDPSKTAEFKLKGKIGDKGAFDVQGQARMQEPSASARLNLADLPLDTLSRLVPGLPVAVLSGQARLEGEVKATLNKGALTGGFTGQAALTGARVARPGQQEPWASLNGVKATGLALNFAPLEIKAASISVDAPALKLEVDAEGKPVLPIAASPAPKTAAKSAPEPAPRLELGSVSVTDGRLDLVARGFEPPLTTGLSGLNVTITALRTDQKAALELAAKLGHSGVFKASGGVGVAGGAPLLSLNAGLENLDLGEVSPVSQKFTGFPITRGRLGLALDWKSDQSGLDFKNRVTVSGLQLGRKTAVPGGKDVPLDLAVSLLTDSKGVIDLDIPVKGSFDNAKVDLKNVISTAVAGAMGKILFAPLAFLNVSGGGGRTVYAPFAPGTAELSPDAIKSLTALAGALSGRPRLNVEIMSYVDPQAEGEAYARILQARRAAGSTTPAPAPEPTWQDWADLARKRMEVVWSVLTTQAGLPPERVYPLTGDASAPPKVQGQPGTRAEVRLRN